MKKELKLDLSKGIIKLGEILNLVRIIINLYPYRLI